MTDLELKQARDYAKSVVTSILGRAHRGAVDDVLQDASVRAWSHQADFRGECALNSWFYRIAINQALMYLRSQRGDRSVTGHSVPLREDLRMPQPDPERRLQLLEQRRYLAGKLRQLSPKLRGEMLRFILADRGDPLNSVATRKARRFRAIQILRQELTGG